MNSSQPNKIKWDLNIKRPQWVKIMVFQLETILPDWMMENSLYYPNNFNKLKSIINNVLTKGEKENVNLIVFPELSIPKIFLEDIKTFSSKNEIIIIAGSHYDKIENNKIISKCPIIYNNKIFYSEKLNPAPTELSSLPNHGSSQGQNILVFENTPIGNFSVLICSDNLMSDVKNLIREENLDFWIIPSFQHNSEWHFERMTTDVEDTRKSRYIIYCNNKLEGIGDGRSSFFGDTNKKSITDFISKGYTDDKYKRKLITLKEQEDYYILEVDIEFKRPHSNLFPTDSPNIKIIEINNLNNKIDNTTFNKLISHIDDSKNIIDDKQILESFHNFILRNYLKNNVIFFENNITNTLKLYSSIFFEIVEIKKGNDLLNNYDSTNLIINIIEFIEKSQSQNPLLINGYPGCGKSTFLSILYLCQYYRFKLGYSNKIPILINLHHYNKFVYPDKTTSYNDQAKKKLINDLSSLFSLSKKDNNEEIILIIDGADESDNPKVNLDDFLQSEISKLSPKSKIIGLRKHKDEPTNTYSKTKSFPLIEDPEVELEIGKVKVESDNFINYIQAISELEAQVLEKDTDIIKHFLIEKITQFKINEVDIFLTQFLLKSLKYGHRYSKAKSLSLFCKISIMEDFRLEIDKCAELAFKFFNKSNEISDKDKNRKEWWIIQKHETLKDFLVAYNIIKKLIELHPKIEDVFDFVYPSNLNNFCKEIINEDVTTQKKAFESIKKLMNKSSITAQTHFCYLLGRFDDKHIKDNSKLFLLNIKAEAEIIIKKKIPFDSTKILSQEDKKQLLYLRTIYISLTYLGDASSSNEYINQLIQNKYFDNLNRGFHLEYYGDIPFSSKSDSLKHEDSLKSFSKTYNKLYNKLKTSLDNRVYYSLFQIELYTLCSLAQHRQAIGNLESNHRLDISDLISRAIFIIHDLDPKLSIYLKFMKDRFEKDGKFKIGSFTKELFSLKNIQRQGWVKRNIINPESVAAHMYGAFMLGYLHLPTQLYGQPSYDKSEILKMILIHDLGEAYVGDLTPDEKTNETNLLEEKQFKFLSLIGTYDGLASMTGIHDLFHKFTHNKDDINCIIAREIDKLDNLLQLYIYHNDIIKGPVEGFLEFKTDLIGVIASDVGRKIMKQIEELFEE